MTSPEKELEDSLLTLRDMAVEEKLKAHWSRIVEGIARKKGVPEERIKEIKQKVLNVLNQ